MSDPDGDAPTHSGRDLRFDNWPVERYDEREDWQVEGEALVDRTGSRGQTVQWLGLTGANGGQAFVYEPEQSAIFRGEVDPENERVLVDETHSEPESDDSFGQRLEEIGDEHGWTWLSSFAREHLEDEDTEEYHVPEGVDHEFTEFQRRNVLDDAEPDAGFFGSHTFADETDRVHMLERDFDVYLDDGDSATVQVLERYLVAEDPKAERREGDADLVDEREYELGVDADQDDPAWESHVEGDLQEWHEHHLAPPRESEARARGE